MSKQEAFESVLEIFNGDKAKARFWWNTKNPHFGNIRPVDLLELNSEKVFEFIKYAKDET